MEGQVSESQRSPDNPREVLGRIITNAGAGKEMNPAALIPDLLRFSEIGNFEPKTTAYLRDRVGCHGDVRAALILSIDDSDSLTNGRKVLAGIKMARIFGMDIGKPKTAEYLDKLSKKYEPKKKISPACPRRIKGRLPLAALTALTAIAGHLPHQTEAISRTIFKDAQPPPIVLRIGTAQAQEEEQPQATATVVAAPEPELSPAPTEKPKTPTPVPATATATAKATATATATATPKPTETPKPTPTPEIRTFKKDILREQIAPIIYAKIQKIRAEKAAGDPDYEQRINKEINEGKINILITGGREDDDLTDSIQLFSWDFATNTLYVISIPRDLQSPEVLQKTKNQVDSKINQATHFSRKDGKPDPALLKLAVENATGISVDLYMHLGFSFFKDAINKTVKTIDVVLDKDIEDKFYPTEDNWYKTIKYSKGPNKLNGEQALEIARVRHIDSDYERSKRQQMIIEALIKQILSDNFFNQFKHLSTLRDIWYEDVLGKSTIKPDFDLDGLFFDDLGRLVQDIPHMIWGKLSGQAKMAEMPTIFTTGLTNRNYVVDSGIKNANGINSYNTKISGGNPNTANPRRDYWKGPREFVEKFIKGHVGEPPEEEEFQVEMPANEGAPSTSQITGEGGNMINVGYKTTSAKEETKVAIPAKEQRILYPQELSYEEVKPWIGKLRNSHDSVLTESLFTRELAALPQEKRQEVMKAIAMAHAKALIEYYGDVDAIIGLDPGHGGSDVGSSGTAPGGKVLTEKSLTWELSQIIADEIYQQSGGKYTTIFLRPENPHDEDTDGDGVVSAFDRIQKRKAQLLEMERKLRPSPNGKNLLYLSVHFNGDATNPDLKGTETYWPNETGVADQGHRDGSRKLAQILHQSIL
ncbi:hypothetical protein A3J19_05150, partial [Candidatus Daviesbacteria bacterium RIFCSPLOWO2_02_FULL_41_8]